MYCVFRAFNSVIRRSVLTVHGNNYLDVNNKCVSVSGCLLNFNIYKNNIGIVINQPSYTICIYLQNSPFLLFTVDFVTLLT